MSSKIVRFLGSIRLAVPLLVVIAITLIAATILESQVGGPTIQRLVYKSPWFGMLMFLLAMNLGISTVTRFPWKGARKIGFALTHLGLIVIIAGSAAVIHLNTEGMLLVRTDGAPRDEIRVEGDLLDVMTPEGQHLQTNVFVRSDGSVYPRRLGDLSLLGYTENSIQDVRFDNDGTTQNYAVELSMQSDRMGQTLNYWLSESPVGYQSRDLGPASLELLHADSTEDLDQLLTPPDQRLGKTGQLMIQRARQPLHLNVDDMVGQTQKLDQNIRLTVSNVWPDFRLNQDGQPTSSSQNFLNPALELVVTQGDQEERWFVFGNPDFPTIRSRNDIEIDESAISYQPPSSASSDFFRVIIGPDRQIYYAANASRGFVSGLFEQGKTVSPGWSDFQFSLAHVYDHAIIQRSVVPVEAETSRSNPALLVATSAGEEHWLSWGDPASFQTQGGEYFAAFSPKVLKLPFQVELNDFIVERNEGSESVAMWTSDVNLVDGIGSINHRRVWMNHPTWFQGWKLAQASWNPGDLSQSTLQLKREPWWVTALTWLGSLLVVLGVGTMFYGRAIAKRLPSLSPLDQDEDSDQESVTTATA